ncbi:MAG: Asp-tRNA(Asn)/Glu-tRNA(Gln) amidotransferase GatCAB subunit A, partial [Bacteroidetes bacterium]
MIDPFVKDYRTLAEIQRDLSADVLTYSTLADSYLSRIAARPELNAFIEVYEAEARAAAARLDEQHRQGKTGPLAGLFLGVKDVICHTGHGVTASSRILKGFESLITSTALQRLLDAGAIVIGRQGCDEFAMGSSSESS